ncbi:uncharacterized protein LOC131608958 isoform X2 [Vicia villosa]|uniref:uncharacterized protein LOC131608958 isoform X2 n=1 Tax=Vicia villosa TaxID=3911 RepID=UPI00273B606B|nr:uncharacterized protein LOC131608958 isoform X2 [Vicia villosa]
MSTAFSFSSSTQALILNSTSTSPSTSVSLRRIITIYAPNSVNKVVGIGTRTGRRKWNMAVSKSVTTTTRFDDSVVDSASTVEIIEFFKKFTDSTSLDLQFVIDDLSMEDSSSVGVTWHLEWKGKTFPFSKGCSFYRLEVINGKRQITYGRDSVEPAIKPGEATLTVIKSVTWLLQRFPQLADRF